MFTNREVAKERARNFFYHLTNFNGVSAYYLETPSKIFAEQGGACHANIRHHPFKSALVLASNCFSIQRNSQVQTKYLEWLMNPKISPFRSIIKGEFEILRNKKQEITGFLFPDEMIGACSNLILFSFMTFARQLNNEGCSRINTWDFITENSNIDKASAFLLASLFVVNNNKNFIYNPIGGHHWPIAAAPGTFSLKRFISGKINGTSSTVNGLWQGGRKSVKPLDIHIGRLEKTEFSSVRLISLDDLEVFLKTEIENKMMD